MICIICQNKTRHNKYLKLICALFVFCTFNMTNAIADTLIDSIGIYAFQPAQAAEEYIYIDNLIRNKSCEIPSSFFYSFRNTPQLELYYIEADNESINYQNDRENKIGNLYIRTRNAQSGFLEINDSVSSFIKRNNIDLNSLLVKYLYNGNLYQNEDAYHIVRLKKEDIINFKLDYDAQEQTMTVSIESETEVSGNNSNESAKLRKVKLSNAISDTIRSVINQNNSIDKKRELLEITFNIIGNDLIEFGITKRKKDSVNYTNKYFLGYEVIDGYLVVVRALQLNNLWSNYFSCNSGSDIEIKDSNHFARLIDPGFFYYFRIEDNIIKELL